MTFALIAIKMFGATRLSAIIFNLRKQGHDIETVMVEGTTRYGTPTQYAKYIYRGEKNGRASSISSEI